jgi:hypothetical protein
MGSGKRFKTSWQYPGYSSIMVHVPVAKGVVLEHLQWTAVSLFKRLAIGAGSGSDVGRRCSPPHLPHAAS